MWRNTNELYFNAILCVADNNGVSILSFTDKAALVNTMGKQLLFLCPYKCCKLYEPSAVFHIDCNQLFFRYFYGKEISGLQVVSGSFNFFDCDSSFKYKNECYFSFL